MATANYLLKIKDLSLTEEKPLFTDDSATMHFMNILKSPEDRKLLLRVHGSVSSGKMTGEWGGDSFYFTPESNELDNLAALEKLAADVVIPDRYVFKKTMNEDHQLNIKLKLNKKGKFVASVPFTPETVDDDIELGRECILELEPGFYFSLNEKKEYFYGLFYKLKSLKFNDELKATKVTKKAQLKK